MACLCGIPDCADLTVEQYLDRLEAQLGEHDESGRPVAPPQQKPSVAVPHLRLVCSWCQKVLEQGTPGAEVSHGMCADCEAREFSSAPPQKPSPLERQPQPSKSASVSRLFYACQKVLLGGLS